MAKHEIFWPFVHQPSACEACREENEILWVDKAEKIDLILKCRFLSYCISFDRICARPSAYPRNWLHWRSLQSAASWRIVPWVPCLHGRKSRWLPVWWRTNLWWNKNRLPPRKSRHLPVHNDAHSWRCLCQWQSESQPASWPLRMRGVLRLHEPQHYQILVRTRTNLWWRDPEMRWWKSIHMHSRWFGSIQQSLDLKCWPDAKILNKVQVLWPEISNSSAN